MALEIVNTTSFTYDILGDGLSTIIDIGLSAAPIRELVRVSVSSSTEGLTAVGVVTARNLTITFSLPFTGVVRVTGEYVI